MATPANDLVQACGCAPDPFTLLRLGVFDAVSLLLGMVLAMIVLTGLAGWVLATLVWLAGWPGRRARAGPGGPYRTRRPSSRTPAGCSPASPGTRTTRRRDPAPANTRARQATSPHAPVRRG